VAKNPAPSKDGKKDKLEAFLARAEAGDQSVLPALREMLASDSWLVEAAGNLATQIEHTLIANAAGKSLLLKETVSRKMDKIRKELAGEKPTPLERLLVERVAFCWLALHDAELRFAQAKGLSIPQSIYWHKRIDSAHKRYLSAIKALA